MAPNKADPETSAGFQNILENPFYILRSRLARGQEDGGQKPLRPSTHGSYVVGVDMDCVPADSIGGEVIGSVLAIR